jgi:predicted XRE-type DNA-binding protein
VRLIFSGMTSLGEWLRDKGVTQAQLGERVGLTQGRISQIVREGTNDAKTALAIVAATDGLVPLEAVLPRASASDEAA